MTSFLFAPTSRYYGLGTRILEDENGKQTIYLERRFVPAPERFALLQVHRVARGERPDTVAALHLEDPEQFWRLCDANRVLRPDELTERPGRELRIGLPEGIPGTPGA